MQAAVANSSDRAEPVGWVPQLLPVLMPLAAGFLCYLKPVLLPSLLRSFAADALWAYAFIRALLWVWEGRIPVPWLFVAAAVGVFFEYAQYAGWLPGTGDLFDVLVYVAGGAAALFVNGLRQKRMAK